LATHRIVSNLENFEPAEFLNNLKKNFELAEFSFDNEKNKLTAKQKMLSEMKAQHDKNKNAFGVYCGKSRFFVAALKNTKAMDAAAPDMSEAYRSLDVAVLQKLILNDTLGIDQEKLATGNYLEYVKDTPNAIDDSIADVDAGKKQIAFFTNPPKIEQINLVADAGERMPQKSTYFYPKVFTGLTINKL
jgi:uncharacterized protein (DUF1015 family)